MLRQNPPKNSPRTSYIVDSIPKDQEERYILIRILNPSLRLRLYKVHPEELIHMPSARNSKKDKPTLTQKPRERQAAKRVKEKRKSSISSIRSHPDKFKHGWSDHDHGPMIEFIPSQPYDSSGSNSSTTSITSSRLNSPGP